VANEKAKGKRLKAETGFVRETTLILGREFFSL
jgi:hypothetical protein